MTRKDFDDLVRRMERRHAGRPAALERSTTAWMALGLAGFLGWVGLLFAVGIAAFAAGVVLPFEAGVWLLIAGVFIVLFATSQAFLFFSVEHAPSQGHALRAVGGPGLAGDARLAATRAAMPARSTTSGSRSTSTPASARSLASASSAGPARSSSSGCR